MTASTSTYTGFGPNASGGFEVGPAATPTWKPPTGMTYGSGVGASSGIGSNLTPTAGSFGRFAGGLLSGLTGGGGGGSASSSAQPQSRRMAGSDDFLKALQAFSSNNSGGFTSMGDGFSVYQPPTPGAEITETTKSEGGGGGSRSTGSRIGGALAGAGSGFMAGAATGLPHMAGVGAVAGGLGGLFG